MRAVFLLAFAAAGYALAAWMVAPGFYDGIGPVQPYNWVSPPPEFANGNLPPKSGHLVIKVIKGVSDANSAFTDDGQVVLYFLPGAFDSSGPTITVDITPVTNFPAPGPYHFATNVYLVAASAPLVKPMNVLMRYSNGIPQPSDIYNAPSQGESWSSLGANQQSQVFTITSTSQRLGYFAAGYPANASTPPGTLTIGGGQALPLIVAAAIALVVLAGVPIAVMRRRRGHVDEDTDPEEH